MTAQSVVLVDGAPTVWLPATDRGLMYGDGVFRTVRVADGKPRWWHEHVAKLAQDCTCLGLLAPAPAQWLADLDQLAPHMADGVLKLLVTRGSGQRGYLPPEGQQVRRLMYYDASRVPASVPLSDITLRVCTLRLGWQPRLAGIKHLNRLENVLARAEWHTPEIHEGLLLDQAGNVISGVMSNLFLWHRNRLLTPRLDQCGVAGLTRARLMRLAQAEGLDVQETALSMQDVLDADELMLTNSLWGLRRVARLETTSWPTPVISVRLAGLLDA